MYTPAPRPPAGPRALHRSPSKNLLPFGPSTPASSRGSSPSSTSTGPHTPSSLPIPIALNYHSPQKLPGSSPSRPALKLNVTPTSSPNFRSNFSGSCVGYGLAIPRSPSTPPMRDYSPMKIDDPSDEVFTSSLSYKTIRPPVNQTTQNQQYASPSRYPRVNDRGYAAPKLSRAFSVQDLRRASIFRSSNPGQDALERYPHSYWSDDVLEPIDRLGEGVGGAVHSVKHTRTGTVMARKIIATREAPVKQLFRELMMITTIEHPNIVHFYGAYMSPSSSEVKVLMELCEGGSLQAVVERIKKRRGRVGEKVAGRLAEGILQGLDYLHTKRLIHRDIKPSNVLLSRDGVVKLCDFGVSGELVKSHADTYTGTCYYMAPERITGNEYSIRADIWSTGLSILELAQNRFPYPEDLPFIDLMIHISQNEPPQLEDDPQTKWSDAMKEFIRLCLTMDPALRPTPRNMIRHPWIVQVMKTKIDMGRWICDVWGWNSPADISRSNSSLHLSKENVPCAS